MCGTPVAALDRGAVGELVDEGRTGHACASLDALADGLDDVLALDRGQVRACALERFRPDRMVDAHVATYRQIVAAHRRQGGTAAARGLDARESAGRTRARRGTGVRERQP